MARINLDRYEGATKNVHKPPTAKEQLFVNVYCSNGFDRLEAYKLAYPNQAPHTYGNAYNVWIRPKIQYLINKKIQEEVMDKIDMTTDELLGEAIELLNESKDWGREGGNTRKATIELLMKAKGMLVEKRETTDKTFADFVKEEEQRKASGSDLKIVEMPKNE